MGDFTDLLKNLPEIGPVAKVCVYYDTQGIEINEITPLDGSGPKYESALNVNTNQGTMTMRFGIKAVSIQDAITGWRIAATEAMKEFGAQMKANERRIIAPGNEPKAPLPFRTIQ